MIVGGNLHFSILFLKSLESPKMIKKCLLAFGCMFALITNDNVVFAAETLSTSGLATVHQVKGIANKGDKVDFSRFGEAVGDKRIVLLDELTHGEGNVFELKRQVIEYLHQHKGFDVLLLESGIYDVSRMWQNAQEPLKTQSPGKVFYMYANDDGVHRLFDYIDANRNSKRPLYLAGFDGRLSGEPSVNEVVNKLQGFVNKHFGAQGRQVNWASFNKITQQILKRDSEALNKLNEQQRFDYLMQAGLLADLLSENKIGAGYSSSGFWAQVVKGNTMVGQQLWGYRRSDENDLVMGENVQWLLDNLYPNKKVVVWGHFVHVNRLGLGPTRYANLGTELIERYPNQVYMTHFSGAKGEYTDFITMKTRKVPVDNAASFENGMLKADMSIGFIDKSDVNFNHPKAQSATLWGYDYSSTMPLMAWPKLWDGMFVLDEVTP